MKDETKPWLEQAQEHYDDARSKSHHLDGLARKTGLHIPESWYEELAEITRHFWRVRYPDFQQHVYTSREKVDPTMKKTKEVYTWMRKQFDRI